MQKKVDSQPEVKTVNLEEYVVTILKAFIHSIVPMQLPCLVFLHGYVVGAHGIEELEDVWVACLHDVTNHDF